MLKTLIACCVLALTGCQTESGNGPTQFNQASLKATWRHNIGDGIPHRGSYLRDGTEIITIGQHDHGSFLLLIRYADEDRFTVINQDGEVTTEPTTISD